ncbi:MAG: hypothetical protein ACREJL_09495, partial [Candidatus Methylomirabilales bacterium]
GAPAASANVARGLQALLPWQDPGRRKPHVACLGRNPLPRPPRHRTSDFGLQVVIGPQRPPSQGGG